MLVQEVQVEVQLNIILPPVNWSFKLLVQLNLLKMFILSFLESAPSASVLWPVIQGG